MGVDISMENNFSMTIKQTLGYLGNIGIVDLVDIGIMAVVIYFAIGLIRRAQTYKVFQGLLFLFLALWLSDVIGLHVVNFLLRNAVEVGLLALIVLFQPEIRRFLEKLGAGRPVAMLFGNRSNVQTEENTIMQTVLACADMSATKTGALIIFERDNRLDDQIRTGTVINADTTAELLKNIFYPKAPLHDGAVIVRNGRIMAGGCMLPLSANQNLSRELGMRHRAGIGMSEASDAVVVIVSEESGAISVATDGTLKRHLTKNTFEKILRNELLKEEIEETSKVKNFLRKLDRRDVRE